MHLSRNVKQNGLTGIIAIVSVILNIWLFSSLEYANTVKLESQDIVAMLESAGKDIVPVEFQQELVVPNSAKLRLMGGLALDAQAGDVLIFRKENGAWIEVGRYLTEGIE